MSQCVPSWDLDESPYRPKLTLRSHSNSVSLPHHEDPANDYEVAELTWENGQLAMHGLGPPRVPTKFTTASPTKYTWEKPRAGGTLESIVNPANLLPYHKGLDGCGKVGGDEKDNELVPWFSNHHRHTTVVPPTSTSATMTMDALVPCSNNSNRTNENSMQPLGSGISTCEVGCSTRVGSCSGAAMMDKGRVALTRGDPSAATAHDWSSGRDLSQSGSATCGRDSLQVTVDDTCDREFGTSMGSLGNTSSGKQCTNTTTGDDHDSVCHSRPQRGAGDERHKKKGNGKSSLSTKRSKAAAIHNQSERKRRDKINQRMKTLQKLVPSSSKTDKASMLDEVIDYLKQLQAQVQMMSRMNMSPAMMLPMAMQQQLQMSMMAQQMGSMGMGMGAAMGLGHHVMHEMNMNTMGRPNIPGIPSVLHPSAAAAAAAFMPLASWDAAGDRMTHTPASVMSHDPMAAFLACQSQPMTMDAYTRMATLYQQMHQQPPGSKN